MTFEIDTTPDATLRAASGAISAAVDDELMIFVIESSRYIGLRGAAIRTWALLEEGTHNAEQIVAILAAEFDADATTIRRDLAVTLADLDAFNLVQRG